MYNTDFLTHIALVISLVGILLKLFKINFDKEEQKKKGDVENAKR